MTSPIRPITSTLRNMGAKATTGTIKGNPVLGFFMVGCGLLTYKLMKDSFEGNEAREAQGVAAERSKKDYALLMNDVGSMSGKGPTWDSLRHSWKAFTLYGPKGWKEYLQEKRDEVHSIIKEVIMPNLEYAGITVAAMYGFFGPKNMHAPFKYMGKKLGGVIFSPTMGNSVFGWAKSAFKKTIDGSAFMLRKAFEYPAVATGMVLLSALLFKTFQDVNSGRAQNEYFRHELLVKDGSEE